MAAPTVEPEAMVGCGAGTKELAKVRELKHVEVLDRDATDVWTACKHAMALLLDLAPDYFARAEFEQGSGGPGSIGVFHFGYAVPRGGSVKHRIDKIDDDAQIFAYSVIKTDNATSSSSIAKMQFTSAPEDSSKTTATWTLPR